MPLLFVLNIKFMKYSFDSAIGIIEKWYKKEGDLISKEDVICDIKTEVSVGFLLIKKCFSQMRSLFFDQPY